MTADSRTKIAPNHEVLERLGRIERSLQEILNRLPAADDKLTKLLAAAPLNEEFTTASLNMRAVQLGEDRLRSALLPINGDPEGGIDRLARFLSDNAGLTASGRRLENVRRVSRGEVYRVVEMLESSISATRKRLTHDHGGKERKR